MDGFEVVFADIHNENSVVEIAIGPLTELAGFFVNASITVEVFEAHDDHALVGVGDSMLEAIGVGGILSAEDVGAIASVNAIGTEPEVELAACFDGTGADAVAEVERIAAPGPLAGCTGDIVGSTAGDVFEQGTGFCGGTGGFKGELVLVARAFVDEVAFDVVVKLEVQLGEVNLGEASGFELETFFLNKLLEGKMFESGLGSGLDRGLGPGVVPVKGASGLSLGNDAGDGSGENGGEELNFHG